MLEIGRVVRPHGLKGEVVVELISNRPDRLVKGAAFDGGTRELVIDTVRAHQGRWLVQFVGVGSRESAELLRGLFLRGEPSDDPAGDDEALWVHRLIGSQVFDQTGTPVGTVTSVEANPASDLLVLDTGGLIPCRFVTTHGAGEVRVDIPEGLLDLS